MDANRLKQLREHVSRGNGLTPEMAGELLEELDGLRQEAIQGEASLKDVLALLEEVQRLRAQKDSAYAERNEAEETIRNLRAPGAICGGCGKTLSEAGLCAKCARSAREFRVQLMEREEKADRRRWNAEQDLMQFVRAARRHLESINEFGHADQELTDALWKLADAWKEQNP